MTKDDAHNIDRRTLFSLGAKTAIAVGTTTSLITSQAAQSHENLAPAPKEATKAHRYVTATEGTNIAAAVSPDGERVAFDLYGVLWLLHIDGGQAIRLTDDLQDVGLPSWSPDNKHLAFQSYRHGNFHIWTLDLETNKLIQLTTGPFDHREPCWSPDGASIAFSSDRESAAYRIYTLELKTGGITRHSDGPEEQYSPAWSPDSKSITFVSGRLNIDVLDTSGNHRRIATLKAVPTWTAHELHSPAFTPDGRDIVFVAMEQGGACLRNESQTLVSDEDVFPFRPSWLPSGDMLYTSDGKIKRRAVNGNTKTIEFSVTVPITLHDYTKRTIDWSSDKQNPVLGIASPVLSPDGQQIAFRALNDIWIMKIGDKPVPQAQDAFCKLDPAWSPDGQSLLYSSDRGGKLDLWLHDLQSDIHRQITDFKDAAIAGVWSPNGKLIAFYNQWGALHILDIASGHIKQIYRSLHMPGKPSWSPDNQFIALAAVKPYSSRFREGLSEILTINILTGDSHYQPIFPHKSIATRGEDGPIWSPDGKSFTFVFASLLYIAPITPDGRLTGKPSPLNNEVTDAPSWNGDSDKILYLSSGKLRLLDIKTSATKTILMKLRWQNKPAKERTILRAGKLWDGLSPHSRSNVDVIMEEGRIAAVVPAGEADSDLNAHRIDGSNRFVMPGLIDMHVHRQMLGLSYGDRDGRLWLSFGVTTTRGTGGPAYHTLEDKESIQSGARIGPRYYAAGEALDGSRIYYDFTRPITEPGQMRLELDRANALKYDLLKTYVRLPSEQQKMIIQWAHQHGLPVSSHYHYPSLSFGIDGMEHLGATARTGYSRTISALGNSYQDVTALFLHSKAARTATLFYSQILLTRDKLLLNDHRITALYPEWEQKRLIDRVAYLEGLDEALILENLKRNVEEITETTRQGGTIVMGADAPIDFPGLSLHINMRAMVKFGMTPFETLVTATRRPGEHLDAPLGLIHKGYIADLNLIDGDPLANINDASNITHIIKGGELFNMDEIIGPFAERPAGISP